MFVLGTFNKNAVNFIEVSNIETYIQGPQGVFRCENFEVCNFGQARYMPSKGEITPDVIACPECGKRMVNQGLNHRWSSSIEQLRRAYAGTPETYDMAFTGLSIFQRLYSAEQLKTWDAPEVPALDIIIDIAPKVFDKNGLNAVFASFEVMNFKHYTLESFKEKISFMESLKSFYDSIPLSQPIRQVDLAKQLKNTIPEINEPTWVFYIWRQFALINVVKQGRYNILTKSKED